MSIPASFDHLNALDVTQHRPIGRALIDQYGVDEINNHGMIVTGDHIGTHRPFRSCRTTLRRSTGLIVSR